MATGLLNPKQIKPQFQNGLPRVLAARFLCHYFPIISCQPISLSAVFLYMPQRQGAAFFSAAERLSRNLFLSGHLMTVSIAA
jgi:hypothetical protein